MVHADFVTIEKLLMEGRSVVNISTHIKRNMVSIYRVIEKNSDPDGVFRADSAWKRVFERVHKQKPRTKKQPSSQK